MWRKSRQPHGTCVGADINRNWDFHHNGKVHNKQSWRDASTARYLIFLEIGSSSNPCSETFAGPKPFSEVEALVLSKFIQSIAKVNLYISFHSYSQLLMFPYVSENRGLCLVLSTDATDLYDLTNCLQGFTTDPAPNHDDMVRHLLLNFKQ